MNEQPEDRKSMFTTLAREATLAERVTGQIEAMIVTRQLQPGAYVPAERELAQQFGVSRTVVREAIRALTAKGLLHSQSGGGYIVSRPTAESVAQSMSLFLSTGHAHLDYEKVNEVRRLLEVEIAGLAAQRRTAADLEALRTILSEAQRRVGDEEPNHFAQTDVAFHTALAQATQNSLFALLLDSLVDVMHEVRFTGFRIPGTPQRALAYHRAIFEEVSAGDVEGARRAMAEHLEESSTTQRQVLALRRRSE